ncbi:MAG: flavocytochrome c [Spirochaetales bacterium]|nr:MAG: flavocytochrome c [Spirochaetales bacterium]
MKGFNRFFLIPVLLVLLFAGCGGRQSYKPGTYTGKAEGISGDDVVVEVTVDKSAIKEIKVVEHNESPGISDAALSQIPKAIVDGQTLNVDVVSGATYSSEAVIAAVTAALEEAGANIKKLASAEKKKTDAATSATEVINTDVVVVGAGGAGLAAALSAHENGASVLVLEKMPVVGGNTNYATGGLNAAETPYQKKKGIDDSVELFIQDTMKGGKNINNPELVKVLASNSAGSVEWLTSLGGDFTDVGRMGGASVNRCHRPTGGAAAGNHLVQVLHAAVKEKGITVKTDCRVVKIMEEGGVIKGVMATSPAGNVTVMSKAVVIATGGFGANNDMVAGFNPKLKGFGTTNHPGATGDALEFVKPLNVALVDIDKIQTHPTVVPVKNKMITEAVRGNGAILVNRNAERFISELETRDVVSAAELKQEGGTSFLFFDQGVRESLKAIEKYVKAGLLTEGATIEEVAEKMKLDPAKLKATVDKYNGYVAAKSDPDFSRANMPRALNNPPFYMVEVGPAVHHTMGGLKIDTEARVYNTSDEVIPGLFAAGEVSGGVHGGNRLGGNALSDITTFGRISGKSAAAFAAK